MKVAFIISYAVTIILAIGFIYCVYMKNYWIFKFVDKIKSPVQQLVYVLLMFVSSYVYVYLSLQIRCGFSAVICSILLLILIWVMDYFFSFSFKDNDLYIGNKKRYIFMAYVGACISGFFIAYRDHLALALEISNITISVLIGAYVPFTLLLDDATNGKVELQKVKQGWKNKYNEIFHEHRFKSILSDVFVAMVYGVLLGVALSSSTNIIKDITSGMGMGVITVIIACVGLFEVKKKLRSRKKELRNIEEQEKNDSK